MAGLAEKRVLQGRMKQDQGPRRCAGPPATGGEGAWSPLTVPSGRDGGSGDRPNAQAAEPDHSSPGLPGLILRLACGPARFPGNTPFSV